MWTAQLDQEAQEAAWLDQEAQEIVAQGVAKLDQVVQEVPQDAGEEVRGRV